MIVNHPCLALDACCLINLHASGRLVEIARAAPARTVVTQVVWEQEVPTLRRVEEAAGAPADGAVEAGIIEVVGFERSEAEAFVNYAAELGDDGEAATCAVAFSRGWAVSTDDRAAIRFVEKRAPHIQIVSSLELVAHWAETVRVPADSVRQVLVQIRDVGRYIPGRAHPMWSWWDGHVG